MVSMFKHLTYTCTLGHAAEQIIELGIEEKCGSEWISSMTILCAQQYDRDISTETVHAGTTGNPCLIQKLTRKLAVKLKL